MARFDVFEFSGEAVNYVLQIQANLFADFSTVVVVPLLPLAKNEKEILGELTPVFLIQGDKYLMQTANIGTIKKSTMGKHIANLEGEYRIEIVKAVDFLFQGF